MLEASNEYQNICWLAYDQHFHNLQLPNQDPTLLSLAFIGQAKASLYKHCFGENLVCFTNP